MRLFLTILTVLTMALTSFGSKNSGLPPGVPEKFSIAIHGGAGVIPRTLPDSTREAYLKGLEEALQHGITRLSQGASSLDAVEEVVRILEDNPLFNAGKGAVFTRGGGHELDASIMDGRTLRCGAVTGVTTVRNPISLARLVMEKTPHILLGGAGAEAFADEMNVERADSSYFFVERRYRQWQKAREKSEIKLDHSEDEPPLPIDEEKIKGTVGVVALDRDGNLAAGTSTGGLTNKMAGRVGDSPIVGAGTYADNRTCAVSGTGQGEQFMRHSVAYAVSAGMALGNLDLQESAEKVVFETLQPGDGGIIAVDSEGNTTAVFNSPGMYRGRADASGLFENQDLGVV